MRCPTPDVSVPRPAAPRSGRRRIADATLSAGLALAAAACASTPEAPFAPPALPFRIEHHAGSPISGPTSPPVPAGPDSADPESAPAVRCRAIYVERADAAPPELEPLASRIRLVLAAEGEVPILAGSALGAGARVAAGDPADAAWAAIEVGALGRIAPVADLAAAALPGSTVRMRFEPLPIGEPPAVESVAVSIGGPGSKGVLPVSLDLSGWVSAPTDVMGPEPGTRAGGLLRCEESVVLSDAVAIGGAGVVLLLPVPASAGQPASALAIRLQASPAPAGTGAGAERDAHARLVAESLAATRAAAEERRRGESGVAPPEAAEVGAESALDALAASPHQRSALLFLADTAGAPLAADLALVADDEFLSVLVEKVLESVRRSPDAAPPPSLGWALERAAYASVSAEAGRTGRVSPELRGCVIRNAGEAARFPALIVQALSECADMDAFRRRLVEFNRQFLEDSSPASRVRAYDWLAARGLAPEGFDPLGSRESRRAAIMKASPEGAEHP